MVFTSKIYIFCVCLCVDYKLFHFSLELEKKFCVNKTVKNLIKKMFSIEKINHKTIDMMKINMKMRYISILFKIRQISYSSLLVRIFICFSVYYFIFSFDKQKSRQLTVYFARVYFFGLALLSVGSLTNLVLKSFICLNLRE